MDLRKVKQAFRSLVKEVCKTMSSPLVMFFDDLQWADSESLGIFESLIEDKDMKNIMFVASYHGNEVEATSPLAACMEAFARKKKEEDTTNTQVVNLKKESLDHNFSLTCCICM
jgi:predicted ATPase